MLEQNKNKKLNQIKQSAGCLKRVIPCLDVDNGKVVKGVNFSNMKVVGDPVELARNYEQQGADELVFLDIGATVDNRKTTLELVNRVAAELSIPFTLGGGLRCFDDVKRFLAAGADKVSLNSAALRSPELICAIVEYFGSQVLTVAIDYKRVGEELMVCSHAGKRVTEYSLFEWVEKVQLLGAGELLLTSIDHDGSGKGFDCQTYRALSSIVTVPLIASGGANNEQDCSDAIDAGADAVLAASIFHRQQTSIQKVKLHMQQRNIATRLKEKRLSK